MTYDERNQRELNKLPIELFWKLNLLLELLAEIGEDILITSGKRTPEEQDDLYAQGRILPGKIVTWVKGWDSFHTHGLAIDFVPVGPLGIQYSKRYNLEWAASRRYERVALIAESIGFEWGYRMWGEDKPHLQYTQGLSIAQLKKGNTLSTELAREEIVSYYQRKIKTAENGLKYHQDDERKIRLTSLINQVKRKIQRLK